MGRTLLGLPMTNSCWKRSVPQAFVSMVSGQQGSGSEWSLGALCQRSHNSSCQYLHTMLMWPEALPLGSPSKGDWHLSGEPQMRVPNGFMSPWLLLQTQEWVWLLRSTGWSPWSGCVTAKVTRMGDSCQLQTARACAPFHGRAEQQVPCFPQEARWEFGLFVELHSLYGSTLVSHPGGGRKSFLWHRFLWALVGLVDAVQMMMVGTRRGCA